MSLTAAYGGEKWSQRANDMRADMPGHWGDWGSGSEVGRLRSVLLRRPGSELDDIVDFDAVQMRADLNPDLARAQHDAMADAYEA
ncbi:MAG TPA: amidinotransferase, partial [Chloroflexi bacterium]|nr:amidinotransferase [Chloroflexota bacterium]